MANDTETAPSGSPSAEEGLSSGAGTGHEAENLRLKQEIARLKSANAQAAPILTTLAKWQREGGEEAKGIVDKILRGEQLTKAEKKEAEEAAALTKEDLQTFRNNLVEEIEERIYISESAREGRKSINEWASKEYPGYDGMKGSTAWKRKLAANVEVLQAEVADGTQVPKKFGTNDEALFRWAIDQTYAQVKADNPQLGTEKRVKSDSKEESEARKRAASASTASGSGGDMDDIPEDQREDIAMIRRLGSGRTTGRSWSQRASAAK